MTSLQPLSLIPPLGRTGFPPEWTCAMGARGRMRRHQPTPLLDAQSAKVLGKLRGLLK